MFPWLEIILLIFSGIVHVYFEFAFWVILGLVGYQYWQLQRTQLHMFGVYGYTLRRQVMLAAFYGTIGGIIGSFLMTVVGVTVNQLGIMYIWPVAILLMLIHMRFLCFAYAGGLVALSSAIFGWPEVNVPQVIALVAILHFTESALIAISGRYSAVPVILRQDDGRLVGAFSLQNFWPLPLVLLAAVAITPVPGLEGTIKMPDWWPILPLNEELPAGKEWVHVMVPTIAALGYSDMAVASKPSDKRMASAWHLAVYSVILLGFAILSARYTWLQFIAAVMAPAGHELLIQLDNRREFKLPPRYVPPEYGVMVLDTVVNSPARAIGLQPGDIIINLAGMPVNSGYDLAQAISWAPPRFSLDVVRDGRIERFQTGFMNDERRLGVILVPTGQETHYVQLSTERFGLLKRLRKLFSRR